MSFNIKFGNISDDPRCVFKTFNEYFEVTGILKDNTDILAPSIIVTTSGVTSSTYAQMFQVNYAEIPIFNRKYFITGVQSISSTQLMFTMKIDVLNTYSQQIANLTGTLDRSETKYDKYLKDSEAMFSEPKYDSYSTVPFTGGNWESLDSTTGQLYLTLSGG